MDNTPQKPENKKISLKHIDEVLNKRVENITKEFIDGFDFVKRHPRTVTFFGSARTKDGDSDYILAENLASRISKELGFAVVTGGSVGIMEAANRGAFLAGGQSLGLNIQLPREQKTNKFLTDSIEFKYFFSRKVCLTFSAEAFIYFPGGYGTMDELFEILTLVQTSKIEKIPIILVGSYFWSKFDQFIKENLQEHGKVSESDLNLYKITDNENEIIDIIRNANIREGVEA